MEQTDPLILDGLITHPAFRAELHKPVSLGDRVKTIVWLLRAMENPDSLDLGFIATHDLLPDGESRLAEYGARARLTPEETQANRVRVLQNLRKSVYEDKLY